MFVLYRIVFCCIVFYCVELYGVYQKRLVFEIQIRHILLNSSDKNRTCQMNSIEYA